MKTAGIIGGLGPETTAEFYLELNFACQSLAPTNRPPLLIWNVPLPYEIEQDLLVRTTGQERYLPFLTEAAQRLAVGGADFLVMPYNTLHIFMNEIRASVPIPVLSVVEETTQFLTQQNVRDVGILATRTTLDQGLYTQALLGNGITYHAPNDFEQAKIGKIISNLVLSRHSNQDREALVSILGHLAESGITTTILACTDLQLLLPEYAGMKILAEATVREIVG